MASPTALWRLFVRLSVRGPGAVVHGHTDGPVGVHRALAVHGLYTAVRVLYMQALVVVPIVNLATLK